MKKLLLLVIPVLLLAACGQEQPKIFSPIETQSGTANPPFADVEETYNTSDYKYIGYEPYLGSGGADPESFIIANLTKLVTADTDTDGKITQYRIQGYLTERNGRVTPIDEKKWLEESMFNFYYKELPQKQEQVTLFCGNRLVTGSLLMDLGNDWRSDKSSMIVELPQGTKAILKDCSKVTNITQY